MNFEALKFLLKRVLTESQIKLLSKIHLKSSIGFGEAKKKVCWIIVSLILAPIRCLPLKYQADVKEGLKPVGKMDYSKASIKMGANSYWQHYRLKSAAKEPETVAWIENCIRPTDVFYDIGANVGAYSLIAFSASHRSAKIVSFEPGFSTFGELCSNILMNQGSKNIIPLPLGLSAETKVTEFVYSDISAGAAQHAWDFGLNRKKGEFEGTSKISTPCFRLDDLVRCLNLPLPTLVKIDVDGPELEVLRGAKETLGHPRVRSLLIELEDSNSMEICKLLETYSFRVEAIHRRGSTWANYILQKA